MLTLKKILKSLGKENLQIYGNLRQSISYSMVSLIFNSIEIESNTLYIALASQITDIHLMIPKAGFIIIPDIIFEKAMDAKGELVIWNESLPLEVLFTHIQKEFRKIIDMTNNISSAFSALANGASLKELVAIGSKILGNPIILTNCSYKVMAISDIDIEDETWRFARSYGYCSQQSINLFKTDKITTKVVESLYPVLLTTGLSKDIHRIIKKIEVNGMIIGYIGVYQVSKLFEESDFDAIDILSDIIAVEMKNTIYSEGLALKEYENLIVDLLNNEIHTCAILQKRLQAANWRLKEFFCLIKIPLSEEDESIWFSDYLFSKIINSTYFCRLTKYSSSLVLIINYDKDYEYKHDIHIIEELLRENNLKAGSSRIFTSLNNLKAYYRQASKAYEIGELLKKEDNNLYNYDDISVFHFFSSIQNKNDLQILCHPAYYKLVDYDKINGTEYCRTIYEYILCANSLSVAAEKLFIHRNTMSYRISKISEITGLNLTNGRDIFKLHLSIKIDQWLKL